MTDSSKIAAAIMAAEASRQKQAMKAPSQRDQVYDISGEILDFYRQFVRKIAEGEWFARVDLWVEPVVS
jgi:hypothetical protein